MKVYNTLDNEVIENYSSASLKQYNNATLYLDDESAAKIS